jgi:hypothetical protein
MLSKVDWMDIKTQAERGVYKKDIACSCNIEMSCILQNRNVTLTCPL